MVVAMPREVQILTFTAIGDAYGVCFEYAPSEIVRTRNNLVGYFRHHKYQMGGGATATTRRWALRWRRLC
jgi:hypothetical protein